MTEQTPTEAVFLVDLQNFVVDYHSVMLSQVVEDHCREEASGASSNDANFEPLPALFVASLFGIE